jgi:NitT/TauT family transport system substrate-binding protein
MLRSPNFAIIGRVKSIADLKGKMVGVSSPGSPSQFYVNHLLLASGLSPNDVSYVGIGMGATAVASYSHGAVDAAVLFGSAIPETQSRFKDAVVIADSRTPEGLRAIFGVDDYPASCLLARGEWLRTNPALARGMARAIVRAIAWIGSHSAEEVLAKVPVESRSGEASAELEAIRIAKRMYAPDGRVNPASAETVRRVLAESVPAAREAKIDLAKTYTNEFVP